MANRMILTLLVLAAATPASAQTFRSADPYAPVAYAPGYAGDPGFAGEFVRGTYIGAPLTRVPRPTQIVPSPWSYGTYGVPTVSGIPAAPAAQPTLTVINAAPQERRGGRAVGADTAPGARIIAVQVPRR
ncbi:hypothetical protein CIW48_11000 [Methylobacterium sp. P1-11]|uniref:hypothetical protein n=1 Tax=Methylobacterium sp. P1-11 TaxID=2024616 RepID=UPI0011EC82AF|nr:hypothetical protein [Methylobacterium sp. P1-11]KAA0123992.1 hypothetical protein CIW48_11000 [Methylobacterium sp. P1-11]